MKLDAKLWLTLAAALNAVVTATTASIPPRIVLPRIRPPAELPDLDAPVQEQFRGLEQRLRRRLQENAAASELGRSYGHFGMWHLNYGFPETAERCLRTARRLAPADDRWPYYLGLLYKEAGRLQQAREAFGAVLERHPDDVAALVHLSELEQQHGELERARRHLTRAAELDPAAVRVDVRLGQIARAQDDLVEARRRLERAFTRLPFHPEVHYALGLTYRDLGELERARRHLAHGTGDKSITLPLPLEDPRKRELDAFRVDARAHDDRGRVAFEAGRFDEAVDQYAKARAAAPGNPHLRYNHAASLLKAGRSHEALHVFRELLELEPRFADAHYAIGAILRGEPETAERHLRRALELDPRHVEAHEQLARLLKTVGRPTEAARHFEAAAELKPASSALRTWQVMSLIDAREHARAERAAREAIDALGGRPELRMLLARILATGSVSEEQGREALGIAEQLFESQPTLAVAETIAMAHAALGDFGNAATWQRAALEAASRAGRDHELPWLRLRLEDYTELRTPRTPWAEGEPEAVTAPISVRPPDLATVTKP